MKLPKAPGNAQGAKPLKKHLSALDDTLVLLPLTQLRALAELLQRHPALERSIQYRSIE